MRQSTFRANGAHTVIIGGCRPLAERTMRNAIRVKYRLHHFEKETPPMRRPGSQGAARAGLGARRDLLRWTARSFFVERYNAERLVEKLGFVSPSRARDNFTLRVAA